MTPLERQLLCILQKFPWGLLFRIVASLNKAILFNDLHIESCFKNKKMVKNMGKKNEN
jgi:hypothetical protein